VTFPAIVSLRFEVDFSQGRMNDGKNHRQNHTSVFHMSSDQDRHWPERVGEKGARSYRGLSLRLPLLSRVLKTHSRSGKSCITNVFNLLCQHPGTYYRYLAEDESMGFKRKSSRVEMGRPGWRAILKLRDPGDECGLPSLWRKDSFDQSGRQRSTRSRPSDIESRL